MRMERRKKQKRKEKKRKKREGPRQKTNSQVYEWCNLTYIVGNYLDGQDVLNAIAHLGPLVGLDP